MNGLDEYPVYALHIVCVCTGNICRSPMAEVILSDRFEAEGLDTQVKVSSCGIGGWHVGQGADRRALAELTRAGYDGSQHRAQQLNSAQKDADLLLALDQGHVRDLLRLGIAKDRIRLLRSFDPASDSHAEVDDPYYGGDDGFVTTRIQIEAAADGIVNWARQWLVDSSSR